jgi:hypothetical protein
MAMREREKCGSGKRCFVYLGLIIFGMLFLMSFTAGCLEEIISETSVDDDQVEEEQVEPPSDDDETDGSSEVDDKETVEPPAEELPEDEDEDDNGGISPDYELLEEVLLVWLQEKTGDQDVVMVHADELEDIEAFFERYDLAEDNVIVYLVESTENGEATVFFGLPYSEWTMETVFSWDGEDWVLVTEEEIKMGGQA